MGLALPDVWSATPTLSEGDGYACTRAHAHSAAKYCHGRTGRLGGKRLLLTCPLEPTPTGSEAAVPSPGGAPSCRVGGLLLLHVCVCVCVCVSSAPLVTTSGPRAQQTTPPSPEASAGRVGRARRRDGETKDENTRGGERKLKTGHRN